MKDTRTVTAVFEEGNESFTNSRNNTFSYDDATPYDYLLGALTGCLIKTFQPLCVKMRVEYRDINVEVTGVKREEVPTTLETVDMKFRVTGCSNQKKLESAMEKATRYCSIYQTLSHVAKMSYTVEFAD